MIFKEDHSQRTPYQQAKKRVAELKGFYWHLAIFILVHAFLLLNYYVAFAWNEGFGIWTVFMSFFGWGIGLVFHGLHVFGVGNLFTKNWEERKIRQFIKEEEEEEKRFTSN